jgi:hypothetical protein
VVLLIRTMNKFLDTIYYKADIVDANAFTLAFHYFCFVLLTYLLEIDLKYTIM